MTIQSLLCIALISFFLLVFLSFKDQRWLLFLTAQQMVNISYSVTSKPNHIFICIVDHFEPGNGDIPLHLQEKRMKVWLTKYPLMADKFKDADGKVPQHTWFYPPHHQKVFLQDLLVLCKKGYGDIEMHLHHNRMLPFPDTSVTLKQKILDCLEEYSQYGIFCLHDGTRRFAFIHGDWGLDNSRGEKICGVNNELLILRECGCYADFTFPALNRSQPSRVNKFFYAKDRPMSPKSYDWGEEIIAGKAGAGDLLIIQGILGFRWRSRKSLWKPSIETSDLDLNDEPTPGRVDFWVKNAITVKGRPELKFIKLHTHGAREEAWDSLLGGSAEKMFRHLQDNYNDGKRFILHYVTAREMFNIIKSIEMGLSGNPNDYRNFLIPAYGYK